MHGEDYFAHAAGEQALHGEDVDSQMHHNADPADGSDFDFGGILDSGGGQLWQVSLSYDYYLTPAPYAAQRCLSLP